MKNIVDYSWLHEPDRILSSSPLSQVDERKSPETSLVLGKPADRHPKVDRESVDTAGTDRHVSDKGGPRIGSLIQITGAALFAVMGYLGIKQASEYGTDGAIKFHTTQEGGEDKWTKASVRMLDVTQPSTTLNGREQLAERFDKLNPRIFFPASELVTPPVLHFAQVNMNVTTPDGMQHVVRANLETANRHHPDARKNKVIGRYVIYFDEPAPTNAEPDGCPPSRHNTLGSYSATAVRAAAGNEAHLTTEWADLSPGERTRMLGIIDSLLGQAEDLPLANLMAPPPVRENWEAVFAATLRSAKEALQSSAGGHVNNN